MSFPITTIPASVAVGNDFTHKLCGKDEGRLAYSVDYDYRIKFAFVSDNEVLYVGIGTHDERYR